MNKITIIDYKLGNLNSVANALEFLGCTTVISNKAEDIKAADSLVLPGVGAFERGINNLKDLGLIEILNGEVLQKKKPILGICLGFQLFARESEENGLFKGLGWIDDKVEKLKVPENLRIPHIGWNDISIKKKTSMFNDIPDNNFYFVHSYGFINDIEDVITSKCNYGIDFVASIQKDNIFGTQFHPEKSHVSGLKVLKNFIDYNREE